MGLACVQILLFLVIGWVVGVESEVNAMPELGLSLAEVVRDCPRWSEIVRGCQRLSEVVRGGQRSS